MLTATYAADVSIKASAASELDIEYISGIVTRSVHTENCSTGDNTAWRWTAADREDTGGGGEGDKDGENFSLLHPRFPVSSFCPFPGNEWRFEVRDHGWGGLLHEPVNAKGERQGKQVEWGNNGEKPTG